MPAEDDDYEEYLESDPMSTLSDELEEEDLIVEEEIAPVPSTKKKKLTKRQKRKQSRSGDLPLDVKFLHFRNLLQDNDDNYSQAISELNNDFDKLAFDHDLSKFKWISMLEKSLVLKLKQEQEELEQAATLPEAPRSKKGRKKKAKSKVDKVRDYWKVALKAANNKKKVPDELKQQFLSRMVLGADQSNKNDSIDDAQRTKTAKMQPCWHEAENWPWTIHYCGDGIPPRNENSGCGCRKNSCRRGPMRLLP